MVDISNEIRSLACKFDRFSLDVLIKANEGNLHEQLKYLKENGFILLKKIIFCPKCGSDLGHFFNQESILCPYDDEEFIVDETNISYQIFLTEVGRQFFRDNSIRNPCKA